MGYFEQCGYCRYCMYDASSLTGYCCNRNDGIVFLDEVCEHYMPDVLHVRG